MSLSPSLPASDRVQFLEEDGSACRRASRAEAAWKVAVVDDEEDVHILTRGIFRGIVCSGRGIQLIHGRSGQDAQTLLQQHPDTAVLFLDMAMEKEDAGIDAVEFIRKTLHNSLVRIVLRTGKVFRLPDHELISRYDINDYWEKSELTASRLITVLITSIRNYQELHTIQQLSVTTRELERKVMERTASLVKEIQIRKEMEVQNQRAYFSRIAISALLETSLEHLSLERQLQVALEIILTVPWLSVEYKGSIYLWDQERHLLMMMASVGMPEVLLHHCATVMPGRCLCGLAAVEKKTIFSNDLDARHQVHYAGIHAHGHYCVPILSRDELLGVINLYVAQGHAYDTEEEIFLSTIANTLAGVIRHKRAEAQLQHLAQHDPLTNLPNRWLFEKLLEQELAQARRGKSLVAVFFMDLDGFKAVNDTHGHGVGDVLLQKVAERIRGCLRAADVVARMGGDEFTILLSHMADQQAAARVAGKIIASVAQPFACLGQDCRVGVTVGISFFPDDGEDSRTLLIHADQALYAGKGRSKGTYTFFQDLSSNHAAPVEG